MEELKKINIDLPDKMTVNVNIETVAKMLVNYGNDINAMKNGIIALSTFFHESKEKEFIPILLTDQFSDEQLNDLFDMLFDEVNDFFKKYKKEKEKWSKEN